MDRSLLGRGYELELEDRGGRRVILARCRQRSGGFRISLTFPAGGDQGARERFAQRLVRAALTQHIDNGAD